MERTIFLIDGQSFYASVEKAGRPELENKPVAVGDPERRSGIILAACPIAKEQGVTTASRVGEAMGKCPELVVIRPRMGTYIKVSLFISEIFQSYTDQVEPYSIDEQFLDVTGSLQHYGSPERLAQQIQAHVLSATGVWSRVGIGPTKILAKMATDNFAKKQPGGVFTLDQGNIESKLWPLPIHNMFMVASRMTRHFMRLGIHTIGDLARLDFGDFKKMMRARMGKQSDIQAGYYWQTARGIDPSPVETSIRGQLKNISHGKTLRWHLYTYLKDIEVVLLELVVEVCRRARRNGFVGRVVYVAAGETDGEQHAGFGRQSTLPQPTSLSHEVMAAARKLFVTHWTGLPVSHLSVALSQLTTEDPMQLTFFEDRIKRYSLERALDHIKDRYGSDAVMRASSLLDAGVARERAGQIGGHYK